TRSPDLGTRTRSRVRSAEREHARHAAGVGPLAPPHGTECSHHPPARRSMSFRRTTGASPRYGASVAPPLAARLALATHEPLFDPFASLYGFASIGGEQ